MQAVDLFAGCGGLTLGLRQAGFAVPCAVEIDAVAAASYRANHKDTTVLVKDVRETTAAELLAHMPQGRVDLIAGCAPCQGFCSLNKSGEDDPRNKLVLNMAELIEDIRPTAVLMENVPGLIDRGRRMFQEFIVRLEHAGYLPTFELVQMADYGVPQYRRRLVLIAGRGFSLKFPFATHAKQAHASALMKPWVSVRDAIGGLRAPVTFAAANMRGGPRRFNWHVVRDLQPQTKRRLKAAVPGKTWVTFDDRIRPACHRGHYRGFMNTYGRMRWDEVSPTITSGCTVVAKGRFGHPDRRRYTISVREAAILQSFPRQYRLVDERIDRVCELIGNAVPPLYARRLGESLLHQLRLHRDAVAR